MKKNIPLPSAMRISDPVTGAMARPWHAVLQQMASNFKSVVDGADLSEHGIIAGDGSGSTYDVPVSTQSVVGRKSANVESIGIGTNEILGRAGGDVGGIPVGANSVPVRGGGDIIGLALSAKSVLGRVSGDIEAVDRAGMATILDVTTSDLDFLKAASEAAAVADSAEAWSTVTSPDAGTVSATYDQAEVQGIADLADELKADVNANRTAAENLESKVNAILAALRSAGLMAP